MKPVVRKESYAFKITDSRGFSFLNMLLSLGVFSLIVTSLFPLISFFYTSMEGYRDISNLEWEFFSEQAILELKGAESPVISGETLTFANRLGQKVSYQRYGTYIRRQVNQTGNEIVLQKVDKAEIQVIKNRIIIHVISKVGKSRTLSIRSVNNEAG
ncbi:competence type IV pilus minor pilin ComGF [Metabacillus sp. FJAT-52054]|uniref:Competence type IV pilus minor pilin ComGF n=1 Tax=Metabacillus sediminis TaxID=3117746 RepID=A0ABZ2NE77_9BACI